LGPGRSTLVQAGSQLRRDLGLVEGPFELQGSLDRPAPSFDAAALLPAALSRRGDLHGFEAAVAEADAKLRLEIANRYGNPTIGPAYGYDPTRINLIGAQVALPVPGV